VVPLSAAAALPDRAELLTPAWLTQVLRAHGHDVAVATVAATPVGTGQMAESHRLQLTLASGSGPFPTTVVAKLPTPDVGMRPLVAGAYRAEVSFYRDLAPHLPVRTPHAYATAASSDHSCFVLLLEDLAPRRQGDQLAGCSPAQARAAAVNLAGLHAGSWCDPRLADHDWLSATDHDGAALLGELLSEATATFVARYADRLDAADGALLHQVAEAVPAWAVGRPERFALVHGDYRLDNLMFPPTEPPAGPGSGDDGARDVVALDWQTLSLGLPARDLSYLLATGLATDDRRRSEGDLVDAYHQALVDHGVTGYPAARCFDDYRFGALQGPAITVLGAAYGARTERGDEMFLAMAARSCQAVRDLGTLHLV
jgi:hypothetical protein